MTDLITQLIKRFKADEPQWSREADSETRGRVSEVYVRGFLEGLSYRPRAEFDGLDIALALDQIVASVKTDETGRVLLTPKSFSTDGVSEDVANELSAALPATLPDERDEPRFSESDVDELAKWFYDGLVETKSSPKTSGPTEWGAQDVFEQAISVIDEWRKGETAIMSYPFGH